MSTYFVDEYERQLDERGRIILPAKVRERMAQLVYITASQIDNCLYLYTEEEWNSICERMRALPSVTNPEVAVFIRSFFGTASCTEIDKQGRISLSKRLIDSVGLIKDVVLVGANTRLEIWSKEAWTEYNKTVSRDVILRGIKDFGISL